MSKEKNRLPQGMQFPAGTERRDYAVSDKETILEMNEMVWYPPYAIDTNHYHNCLEIGICMAGSGTLTIGKKAYDFSSGTVIFVPPGLHHSQQNRGVPNTRWRYVVLDVHRFLTELPARSRAKVAGFLHDIRTGGMYLDSGETHGEILHMLYAMFDVQSRWASEAQGEIEAMLLLLLTRAAREPMGEEMNTVIDPLHMKSIEPSLLYVSENYQQEIRMGELARACAMSESYFRKVFTQLMGLSPLEYVNRHRIHRAMQLLHVTGNSVQQIALSCGFPSVATFSRNFVRYVGQNPTSWRRQHISLEQETDAQSGEIAQLDRK